MSRTGAPVHGGPDGGPPITMDFSTNAHPMGPNPWLAERIRGADRSRYPDPEYTALRERLAALHAVTPARVVIGASGSELIWRLTKAWSALGRSTVVTSERTFGEYLRAARALRLTLRSGGRSPGRTSLVWFCNPDNPSGAVRDVAIAEALQRLSAARGRRGLIVADLAYWPFRRLLDGSTPLTPDASWSAEVVQLWTPNKLHGLTGVRGAYLILPECCAPLRRASLTALAPSWLLGADGVALLAGHAEPEARRFLDDTAPRLREWKALQDRELRQAGWEPEASTLHFGLWRPPLPQSLQPAWHAGLRLAGIKLRDARSFGRPGWVRLVTRAPQEAEELISITGRFRKNRGAPKAAAGARP